MKYYGMLLSFFVLVFIATPSRADCTYGPTACAMGFVWREAFSNDSVCVTGAIRQQARDDNAAAASRRSPTGGAYGPDTCLPGFVWREASANDRVCVTGATRTQAARDNRAASSRVGLQCAAVGGWCGAKNISPPVRMDCPTGTSCTHIRRGQLQTVDWFCVAP